MRFIDPINFKFHYNNLIETKKDAAETYIMDDHIFEKNDRETKINFIIKGNFITIQK